MPPLDPTLDALVEHHWQAARARTALFNGRVFSADAVTPTRIEGHWTEYRRVTAQMADPTLILRLQVRSLAVCGAVLGPGGVALGRREPRAAYQPGQWQLPPAGSVDQSAATPTGADWHHAILTELREELGLQAADVTALTPLCLVQHPSGVLDMGIRIDTPLPPATILARHRQAPDQEYDRLLVLPPNQVPTHVTAQGGTLVPPAHAFLAHL